MKKYLWYGVSALFLLILVVATATILDGEHSVFNNATGKEVITATSSPEQEDETSPTPAEPLPPIVEEPRVTPSPITAKCYVGGCSSQLCSSEPDMASTCEWREEYACYQKSACEIQPSGTCGWTPTAELNACLANPLGMM